MDSETSAHLLFVEGGKKQYQEGVQSREPIEHLITDAIAAFQSNNKRFMQKNKRPLDIAVSDIHLTCLSTGFILTDAGICACLLHSRSSLESSSMGVSLRSISSL